MKRTSKINSAVIKEWNKGQKNMSELGDMFGISRGAVSGILKRARDNGLVMAVERSEANRRHQSSMRRKMEDSAYLAALRDSMAYANSFRVRGAAS